jgi:hypothetical protein
MEYWKDFTLYSMAELEALVKSKLLALPLRQHAKRELMERESTRLGGSHSYFAYSPNVPVKNPYYNWNAHLYA